MTLNKSLTCDGCGKTLNEEEMSKAKPWIRTQTMVATAEQYADMTGKLAQGGKVRDVADFGDFCSLICLANWASARASMRELDDTEL